MEVVDGVVIIGGAGFDGEAAWRDKAAQRGEAAWRDKAAQRGEAA